MTDHLQIKLPEDKEDLKRAYYSWLNKKQEDYKIIISDAVDAIYSLRAGHIKPAAIAQLRQGLLLPPSIAYDLADYICSLAEYILEIKSLLLEHSDHPSAKVRASIVTICLCNRPVDLVDTILSKALSDRSKVVRQKAVDVTIKLKKVSLIAQALRRSWLLRQIRACKLCWPGRLSY